METRANYALIGLFTIAVITGAFVFVFWFSGAGKRAEQKVFQVRFTGSVSEPPTVRPDTEPVNRT